MSSKRVPNRAVSIVIGLVASLLTATPVTAQPPESGNSKPIASPLRIEATDFESSFQVGTDRNTPALRLAVRLRVTNESQDEIAIAREHFQLITGGRPAEFGLQESNPPLPSKTLEPGDVADGWVWFSQVEFLDAEPQLNLDWSPHGESRGRLSLNAEVRRVGRIETSRIGPDGCLLKVVVHRNLDVLSVWVLTDVLAEAAANGVERVAFVPKLDGQPVVMDEFVVWLSSLMERATGEPQPQTPFKSTAMTFKHLSIGGMPQSANRRFNAGRGGVQLYESADDGICLAVTPVYRLIPVDRALADLTHAEPGLRRAALMGVVDRLTHEQTLTVLSQIETADERMQLDAAAALRMIPGPEAIATLKSLSLTGRASVAPVALRSLASSQDGAASAAISEVWTATAGSSEQRSRIVEVLLELRDERWTPLLAEHLRDILDNSTRPHDRTLDAVETPSAGPATPDRAAEVSKLLELLRDRDTPGLNSLARRHLHDVSPPAMQDALLSHLLRSDPDDSAADICRCVTDRLSRGEDSPNLRAAAMQFRDPAWTDALVASARQSEAARTGITSMQAALACATAEQLDLIVRDFAEFRVEQQELILAHAALVNHADWRGLAAEQLESPGALSSEAIQLLGQDASEESLQRLRDRLESYAAGLEGTADASVEGQRFFHALIVQVSLFAHPECRRLMNRLARDSNAWVSDVAERRIFESSRRSPAWRALEDAHRLRMSGQVNDELPLLNLAIQVDPLLPDGFVRRASALMHAGRFDEARADLEVANQLSPEELETLSLRALVQIRQGDLDAGLKQAEEVIDLAPRHWVSLYNGACAYARAAEHSPLPAERKLFLADRAIQLLTETADLRFSDVEHLQKDTDLAGLRNHVMWPEVVNRITSNKLPQTAEVPKADR